MDLGESVLFAEKKYLQTLEEFFTRIWGETRLFRVSGNIGNADGLAAGH